MVRGRQNIAFLDTHIVIWLYDKLLNKISGKAKDFINENEIIICPIVILEMQYLYEIKRLKTEPMNIIKYLQSDLGLKISETRFIQLIDRATEVYWTRDVFDRLIVTDVMVHDNQYNAYLISADEEIRQRFGQCVW